MQVFCVSSSLLYRHISFPRNLLSLLYLICFNYVHLNLLICLNRDISRDVFFCSFLFWITKEWHCKSLFFTLSVKQFSSSWPLSSLFLFSPIKFRSYNPSVRFLSAFPVTEFSCTWPKYRIGRPNNCSSVSSKLQSPEQRVSEIYIFLGLVHDWWLNKVNLCSLGEMILLQRGLKAASYHWQMLIFDTAHFFRSRCSLNILRTALTTWVLHLYPTTSPLSEKSHRRGVLITV